VKLFELLRVAATSAVATAVGLANTATGRIESSQAALRAGDSAPEFELAASDGRTYRLSDYRDRQAVVIAWFPKAFTGGCTVECKSMGSNREALRRAGAAFFGASVDDVETNRRFSDSVGAGFPILSDPGKTVARAYGVLAPSGFASRRTFYIGADGRILGIDEDVKVATHGTDIEDRLKMLGISQQA
jgi:thioredoxin-dependent peroxiredoxin